jgi:hypothetical protein
MTNCCVKIDENEYNELQDANGGICIYCKGLVWEGCEPDAREYKCQECENNTIYGIEEALLEGYIDIC